MTINLHKLIKNPKLINPIIVGLSQLTGVLNIVLVANYYTPAQFGNFAIIMLLASLFSTLLTLRLELAIPLVKEIEEYTSLVITIGKISLISIIASMVFIFLLYHFNIDISVAKWVYPISVSMALLNLATLVLTWQGKYITSLVLTLVLSASTLISQVLFAIVEETNKDYGLQNGALLSYVFISIICFSICLKYLEIDKKNRQQWKNDLLNNKNFIIYSSSSTLLFNISSNWPLLLFSSIFGTAEAGLFSMAKKVIDMGTRLIDGSYRNIFYGEFSRTKNYIKFQQLANKNLKILFMLTIFIGFILFSFGENITTVFLKPEWKELSTYILFLLPVFFAVNGTIIHKAVLVSEKENKTIFLMDLALFIIRPISLIISGYVLLLSDSVSILVFSMTSILAVYIIKKKADEIMKYQTNLIKLKV